MHYNICSQCKKNLNYRLNVLTFQLTWAIFSVQTRLLTFMTFQFLQMKSARFLQLQPKFQIALYKHELL